MSTPQHEHVEPIVSQILEDYAFMLTGTPISRDQLETRICRVLYAAVNGELHTELPLPVSTNPQLALEP